MRDHRKLRAFRLADELAIAVYATTAKFPRTEIFGLAAQMRKAAVSIPSNIVEGCRRTSEADYVRLLNIAFASTKELGYQLSLAARLGYVRGTEDARLESQCDEAARVLAGLIRSYQSGSTRVS